MSDEYPYQHIFERDKFTCQYCGWDGSKNFTEWWIANLSIDHIKAVIHEGGGEDNNLVVSCHSCNLYKGSHKVETKEEAKEYVAKKRKEAEEWFNKHVLNR